MQGFCTPTELRCTPPTDARPCNHRPIPSFVADSSEESRPPRNARVPAGPPWPGRAPNRGGAPSRASSEGNPAPPAPAAANLRPNRAANTQGPADERMAAASSFVRFTSRNLSCGGRTRPGGVLLVCAAYCCSGSRSTGPSSTCGSVLPRSLSSRLLAALTSLCPESVRPSRCCANYCDERSPLVVP